MYRKNDRQRRTAFDASSLTSKVVCSITVERFLDQIEDLPHHRTDCVDGERVHQRENLFVEVCEQARLRSRPDAVV